jgi:hypothetical protein
MMEVRGSLQPLWGWLQTFAGGYCGGCGCSRGAGCPGFWAVRRRAPFVWRVRSTHADRWQSAPRGGARCQRFVRYAPCTCCGARAVAHMVACDRRSRGSVGPMFGDGVPRAGTGLTEFERMGGLGVGRRDLWRCGSAVRNRVARVRADGGSRGSVGVIFGDAVPRFRNRFDGVRCWDPGQGPNPQDGAHHRRARWPGVCVRTVRTPDAYARDRRGRPVRSDLVPWCGIPESPNFRIAGPRNPIAEPDRGTRSRKIGAVPKPGADPSAPVASRMPTFRCITRQTGAARLAGSRRFGQGRCHSILLGRPGSCALVGPTRCGPPEPLLPPKLGAGAPRRPA